MALGLLRAAEMLHRHALVWCVMATWSGCSLVTDVDPARLYVVDDLDEDGGAADPADAAVGLGASPEGFTFRLRDLDASTPDAAAGCDDPLTLCDAVCAEDSDCVPGERDERTCGRCGAQQRSCTDDCRWGPWTACSAERDCWPGERRGGDCDPCAEQECAPDCTWGACELALDAECTWELGTNWQCCGDGGWQFCLPHACAWSDQCVPCAGCGC